MKAFNQIIILSKRIASSLLRDEPPVDLQKSEIFSEQEKIHILESLTDKKQIDTRLSLANQINKDQDWKKVRRSIKLPTRKVIVWRYAAAAVLAIMLSTVYFFNQDTSDTRNISPTIVEAVEPGSNKAILTLEDGSEVTLGQGNSYQGRNATSNGEEIIYNKDSKKNKIAYNHLTIPRGGQFFIQLSDGTKVWLNSESKLIYQVSFIEGETRMVELVYGEAYFDVSSSKNHKGSSFKVYHSKQEVQVLGTQFNIKAYKDDTSIYTTLVEGRVAVAFDGTKQNLMPNQQARLNLMHNSLKVATVDVYNETSWKEGIFSFEDKSLKEIMKVLSRWYDVEIHFKDKGIESEEFNGVLGKDQNLENILLNIKNFGVIKGYRIENKNVVLY